MVDYIVTSEWKDAFWLKADRPSNEACWPWRLGRNTKGYGAVHINGRQFPASRVAFVLANGPITDGVQVLHRCDNPPCINPAHLFLGSLQDNLADMRAKGRGAVGERHHASKLTREQVLNIRQRFEAGERGADIAVDFGVSRQQIRLIGLRRNWAHV